MIEYVVEGQGGTSLVFHGECIASAEALNHDDTVRCAMSLYKTESDFVCCRVDRPNTIDQRMKFERCSSELAVYQYLGTEPLANYIYGIAGIAVPGLKKIN